MRSNLLPCPNTWNWTDEHTTAFENLKQKITGIPCLAHYNSNYPNIVTTDASTKGLGATLWQEQPNGELKPIGFASRFLSDTEKKYAINELELLAVVWGLEHFRLYLYGKPIKLLTDHQALEPLIKRRRSNKTYSAQLTRWLDRLAHFTINVSHIAGKNLALTDFLSRNPSAPPQADDVYDEENVINNVIPHYKFVTKYGCLSNHFDQSKHGTQKKTTRKTNNTPKHSKTREQTTINCLKSSQVSSSFQTASKTKIIMDARTIDNLERADNSAETRNLLARWRDIVKPLVYRQSGGRWKKYHEPKFLRNERRVIEEQLQQAIRNVENRNQKEPTGGFQPETRRQEQWTVDPFWDVDRPQPTQKTDPGPRPQIIQQHNNNRYRWKKGKSTRNPIKTRPYSKSPQSIGQSTQALKASDI